MATSSYVLLARLLRGRLPRGDLLHASLHRKGRFGEVSIKLEMMRVRRSDVLLQLDLVLVLRVIWLSGHDCGRSG